MQRLARLSLLALAFLSPTIASASAESIPTLRERAAELHRKGDDPSAAALLESALTRATDAEKGPLLSDLRAAYEGALKAAEASGKSREAALFRDNLEILDRRGVKATPPPPPAPLPAARPAEETAPSLPLEEALPEPVDVPSPEPIPAAAPAKPKVSVDVPALNAPTDDLSKADQKFRAKEFGEAGRLYAALANAGRLPEARRNAWIYCRCVEVTRRMNASPNTAEWKAIRAEIDQIQRLSPRYWFAEYLKNLAAERSGAVKSTNRRKVVLRGASPEEPPTPPAKPVAPARPAAPARVGQPGTPINNWRVWDTPNFRILHTDDAFAEKVARIAEATRAEQTRRWMGATPPTWDPRCDIYLYPNAAHFQKMTGQPEESPGFSTMGMNSGRVVARRLNLRADHAKLLAAVLPHEVTHAVLADLFTDEQIPRWADEGMAVLSEPASEQDLRASELSEPLRSGRLFKLENLMVMDYPDGRYWGLYYAQSVSLTRFLVSQGTPSQFVTFVRGAQRNGVEAELKRTYKIDGFADLEKRWKAASTSSALVASEEKGPQAPESVTRR